VTLIFSLEALSIAGLIFLFISFTENFRIFLVENGVFLSFFSSEGNIIVGREISCRQGNIRIYFPAILCSYT
jgi:hypothetical protein